MSICRLGIETSSNTFAVVLTREKAVLASQQSKLRDSMGLDLPGLVRAAMAEAGCALDQVGQVVVNQGPGNLSAVRSGVAFANALAAGLAVPVAAASSFRLMYLSSTSHRSLPWLCLRRASDGRWYAARLEAGEPVRFAFGEAASLARSLAASGELVFAGPALGLEAVQQAAPAVSWVDSGVREPTAQGLATMMLEGSMEPPAENGIVVPVTEQWEHFGAGT